MPCGSSSLISEPVNYRLIDKDLKAIAEPFLLRFPPSPFKWHGSWFSTALGIPQQSLVQISCKNLFSDVLHRPFLCSTTSLLPYARDIPRSNTIPRLYDLTLKDFANDWTDQPFILTHPVREWPAYKEWSTEHLLEKYGKIKFRAEAVDWPLNMYMYYLRDNDDESPLYLFDHSFVEKMSLKVGNQNGGQYSIPTCFQEDLFDVLGDQRPDRRWLIIGPEKSGSTFHKDPNATRSVIPTRTRLEGRLMNPKVPGTLYFVDQNTGSCFRLAHPLLLHQVSMYRKIKAK